MDRELYEDDRHCPRCHASYARGYRKCPRDGAELVSDGDPIVGALLLDTYRVVRFLGGGALGRVYAARHVRVPRLYAVKFPRGMWVDHPKSRQRLVHEAMAAGRLTHPNVAAVVDVGETAAGLPFLVMELAQGQSLGAYVASAGALPAHEALAIVRQLALGLEHAHGEGVIHRDLKPDNVMIDRGHARIVDFGIAILAEQSDEQRLTTKGVVIGTPFYMAPEQLMGTEIDARADLYALGVILFELVAGRRPFSGTAVEVATTAVTARAPSIAERTQDLEVAHEIEELCASLLERDREKRPASASAVIAAIDRISTSSIRVNRRRGQSLRLAVGSEPPAIVSAIAPTQATDRVVPPTRVSWWRRWFS